ncbi:hypothetical protein C806_02932 [Lachnospiraceae bacterium 3-1]|nr:hypothetical protein C806_02932 [Lachnospiraceae bacterium 3-1]
MKKLVKMLCSMAVFSFAIMASMNVHAADTPANPVEKEGYTLDFADEFNGPSLDTEKWTDYYLPHWCDDPSKAKGNYRFENGCLVEYITEDQAAWCPEHDGTVKSSAIMSFDKSWIHNFSGTTDNHDRPTWYGYKTKYGYFEIRAKLANCGGGGHQAWWMVGLQQDTDDWFNSTETGEIDILETFFSTPDAWRIAAFGWNDPNFQSGSWWSSQDNVPSGQPTEEFHIYAMDWTPTSLKFYYDNQLVKVLYDSPDYEMGTILNIYTDAGSGVHNDVWPKEWYVDYYRVWKSNDGYDTPDTGEYLLRNHQTGKFAYIDSADEHVKYGDVPANEDYAKWALEEFEGYVLLKNVATGEYMHIENLTGYVEHGSVPSTYWSAQWAMDTVGNYKRFTNRWQPDQTIHTEDGLSKLQYGACPETWWTSQWQLIEL